MIITVTGKPCSGKGTVGKLFASSYGFEYMCTGDIFRAVSKEYGANGILEFNQDERIKKIDKEVDNRTINIGKTRLDENIILDSRLAWHFIPNSFKVFLDVGLDTAAHRLLSAKRDSEPVNNLTEAKKLLQDRWDSENYRYQELYQIDNNNFKNYNLVITTDNKTIEEIVEEIYKNYVKFIKNR